MPCNTRLTNTVRLDNEKVQFDLLVRAVGKLYGSVSSDVAAKTLRFTYMGEAVSFASGAFASRARASQLEEMVDSVKQEYAAQLIAKNAQRFGWAYKETTAVAKPTVRR